MLFPEAVIFSKDDGLIDLIVTDLKKLGITQIEILSSNQKSRHLNLSASNIRIVICDFFISSLEIKLFRKLCEQNTKFAVLQNKKLEIYAGWGVDRFIASNPNIIKSCYSPLPTLSQIAAAIKSSRMCGIASNRLSVKNSARGCSANSHHYFPSVSEVQDALKNGEIIPYYQPKMCLRTSAIKGVEVLARWNHPKYGLISPGVFLPIIHQYRLHRILLENILKQGLTVQRILTRMDELLEFSFNIEGNQLVDEDFATWLLNIIDNFNGTPTNITLEITESSAIDNGLPSIENITILARSGVKLSLDDFGTGYSSFERLAELPFRQIKLDHTLIKGVSEDKISKMISSIVFLAESLELEIVAEGVETESQRIKLEMLGINFVQGFLFHKPMSGLELINVIKHNMNLKFQA